MCDCNINFLFTLKKACMFCGCLDLTLVVLYQAIFSFFPPLSPSQAMFGLRVLHPRLDAKRVSAFFLFLLSTAKVDLFNHEQCIRALFMDSQILLFINFFIKNESHGTIHIFKNYFATVFFIFQFSAVSKRTLSLSILGQGFNFFLQGSNAMSLNLIFGFFKLMFS